MQMVSTYSPVPNCSEIKVHIWTNLPIHFTSSFSTFTRVWLPSSPFKDLDKFLKPTPAIFFPPRVRHGKMLQDHREQLIENKEEK